jgi:peptidoglycan-associated lipoprotein
MTLRILSALAATMLLAACSGSDTSTSATGDANAANGGAGYGAGRVAAAPGSQEDLTSNVGDRVFYDLDRTQLNDKSRTTLDRQAGWLARYASNKVLIAGNCDERGTTEYNIALGQRRANAARDYLVSKGVSSSRVRTISYGKERPTAFGSDESAWAQNRNAITSLD